MQDDETTLLQMAPQKTQAEMDGEEMSYVAKVPLGYGEFRGSKAAVWKTHTQVPDPSLGMVGQHLASMNSVFPERLPGISSVSVTTAIRNNPQPHLAMRALLSDMS